MPENAERRRLQDELNAQAAAAQRMLVEHQLAESAKSADELSPRLEYLAALSRTLGR